MFDDHATRIEGREYAVRRYEPSDRRSVLDLRERVTGDARGTDWFSWRYGGPYVDEPPVVVAERRGELVGALPSVALPVRVRGTTTTALQPTGVLVAPDHRRLGIAGHMASHFVDHFGPREPGLAFTFPGERSRQTLLDRGWQSVGRLALSYRVQDPAALLSLAGVRDADPAATRLVRRYLDLRQRFASDRPSRFSASVEPHATVPAGTLERLYERAHPGGIHAVRDEEFYRWRFGDPTRETRSYVARRAGEPVAAVVCSTRTHAGTPATAIAEVMPRADWGPSTEGDLLRGTYAAILGAALRDHASSAVLTVATATLPGSLRSRFGFSGDDAPPLSWLSDRPGFVARPLGTGVSAEYLAEDDNWSLSTAERVAGA